MWNFMWHWLGVFSPKFIKAIHNTRFESFLQFRAYSALRNVFITVSEEKRSFSPHLDIRRRIDVRYGGNEIVKINTEQVACEDSEESS